MDDDSWSERTAGGSGFWTISRRCGNSGHVCQLLSTFSIRNGPIACAGTQQDTPLPPEEPAGQNPPDGAMLDYWLSSNIIDAPVTLDIFDEKGEHLIRHFSSLDKPEQLTPKELNVPMYWVRPARTLSAAPGMHRFICSVAVSPRDSRNQMDPCADFERDREGE